MVLTHPLRPNKAEDAAIWDIAAQVPDPEIPVISIADLGILRDAALIEGNAHVHITPTYSGCPAMEHITREVREALLNAGYSSPQVHLVLQPAWSTDWITERGQQQLRDYGITPPQHTSSQRPVPLGTPGFAPPIPVAVPCPRCGSTDTTELARFGSTSCKALYRCRACLEPFDYFKVH